MFPRLLPIDLEEKEGSCSSTEESFSSSSTGESIKTTTGLRERPDSIYSLAVSSALLLEDGCPTSVYDRNVAQNIFERIKFLPPLSPLLFYTRFFPFLGLFV